MIRCIAVDLDDTLLDKELNISEANYTAIQKAIQLKIKVLLASGRMVQSMRPYAQKLQLDVPLIAYNGAIIQEAISGKTLYHAPVPRAETLKLIPFFREAGIHLNAYLRDELYMDKLTSWGEKYAANAGVTAYPVGDLVELIQQSPDLPHKMLGVGEAEKIDQIQERLREEFGETLQFIKSKPTYLEILAPGVSKGLALQELATGWGIDRGEVMAIGDAWAGVGVAIGNAGEAVKRHADLIVADHNHSGVAEAINKVVFGN
jgi:Cof subfamily protein (haloacid dehalogenase superfamily)